MDGAISTSIHPSLKGKPAGVSAGTGQAGKSAFPFLDEKDAFFIVNRVSGCVLAVFSREQAKRPAGRTSILGYK
jgi:hypothetical protein